MIFKLQMHVSIQKLMEVQLMQRSHLQQALPRWVWVTSLCASSLDALCSACQHGWQQVPAGIPAAQQGSPSPSCEEAPTIPTPSSWWHCCVVWGALLLGKFRCCSVLASAASSGLCFGTGLKSSCLCGTHDSPIQGCVNCRKLQFLVLVKAAFLSDIFD